jgi:mRNA-degrading endonuclease RelE of RelBE toxin-antitoxin system
VGYRLEVSPTARQQISKLPGHVRQRVRRAVEALADNPRPPTSRRLDHDLPGAEPRRLRLDDWRTVYAAVEADLRIVAVVAVRRRPPYVYEDLGQLFSEAAE